MKKAVTAPSILRGSRIPLKGQKLITRVHTLNKQLQATEASPHLSFEKKQEHKKRLEAELASLGGINAYQKASQKCSSKFNSSKWLMDVLRSKLKIHQKLTALDVGSVELSYERYQSQIDCRYIDLNPQHPSIQKMDFFDWNEDDKVALISASLVLNFIGCPKIRTEFIYKAHRCLNDHGYFFVVLPLPTILNSRFLTFNEWVTKMANVGFELAQYHHSVKIGFYLFQKMPNPKIYFRIKDVGPKTNNFKIIFID